MTKRSYSGAPAESLAQAVEAFNKGELGKALRICQALTDKASKNADAFNLQGVILREKGEHKKAIFSFARALALDDANASFHYNMGIAVDATGDRARALSHFKQAHTLNPKMVSTDSLVGWYMQLGDTLVRAGDIPAAAHAFGEAIAVDPRAIDIDLLAGVKADAAIPLYGEMLRAHPASAAIVEKLAYAHFLTGDLQACREKLAVVDSLCGNGDPAATHIQNIYSAGLLTTQTPPLFRRRQRFAKLVDVFDSVRDLDGAVAECGCLKGLSAFVLASRMRDHHAGYAGEGFHIFDSFAGLSAPVAADLDGVDHRVAPNMKAGSFAAGLDLVRGNLADFPAIRFYPGWIPARFAEVADLRFRFLNLDVDLYEPTRDSIAFFYPRLVEGGVITSDDYNWPGCRKAIDEGRATFGYTVTLTDSDQAVIRKE